MSNILELKNISKSYKTKTEEISILKNLNFVVKQGDFISIVGRSGSGKTTFLNILGLLDKIDSGEIYINDKNITTFDEKKIDRIKNEYLGFIFQFHYLLPEFTAIENVILPGLKNKNYNKKNYKKKAEKLLEIVGLKDRMLHKPAELSGGEKQRVAIARALINSPKLILADEPTGNLDLETGEVIFDIFKNLNNYYKQSIIVVTHSQEFANITKIKMQLNNGNLEKV